MNAAYIALIPLGVLAVCIVLFAAGIVFSDRNSSERKSKTSSEDPDDGDEYISLAPTMSVRQIFRAYTRNPSEAEQKYTDRIHMSSLTKSSYASARKAQSETYGLCKKSALPELSEVNFCWTTA